MTALAEVHVPAWTLGDHMRRSLREVGGSVNEMAAYLGVDRSSVSAWLNDRITPSVATLHVWAERTGVPLKWLLQARQADEARRLEARHQEEVRREGLEPPTRWLRASQRSHRGELARVVSIGSTRLDLSEAA